MKQHLLFAVLAFGAGYPAAAQTFQLDCEIEEVVSTAYNYNQPMRRVTVGLYNWTVDPAAKTVLIRWQSAEGAPQTALRDLLVVTTQQLVLCQADVCQRQTVSGIMESNTSLTLVDLQTGTLSRRIDEKSTGTNEVHNVTRNTVRSGTCRRL